MPFFFQFALSVLIDIFVFFFFFFFFFQAEDGIRDADVTGVQTCALPISIGSLGSRTLRRAVGREWPRRGWPAWSRSPGAACASRGSRWPHRSARCGLLRWSRRIHPPRVRTPD